MDEEGEWEGGLKVYSALIHIPIFAFLVGTTISLDINSSENIFSTASKYGVNEPLFSTQFYKSKQK